MVRNLRYIIVAFCDFYSCLFCEFSYNIYAFRVAFEMLLHPRCLYFRTDVQPFCYMATLSSVSAGSGEKACIFAGLIIPRDKTKKEPQPNLSRGSDEVCLLQKRYACMLAKRHCFGIPERALHLADMRFIQ